MDQLIQQLQERTGLDREQIEKVVAGVADFLGDKLPGPIAAQVKKFLGEDGSKGDSAAAGEGGGLVDQAKGMLGGLLGGD